MRKYKVVARKDYPEEQIKKGDLYWYCEPKRRRAGVRKIRRKTEAELNQWIQSYRNRFKGEFTTNMEDWEKRLGELSSEEERDELYQEVQDFYQEKCDNLTNLPEQLQESHILNEQIEQLDNFMEEIEGTEINE